MTKPLFRFGLLERVKRMGAYSFDTHKDIIKEEAGLAGGFCGILVAPGQWNYWFYAESNGAEADLDLEQRVLASVKQWQDDHDALLGRKKATKSKKKDFVDDEGRLVLNPEKPDDKTVFYSDKFDAYVAARTENGNAPNMAIKKSRARKLLATLTPVGSKAKLSLAELKSEYIKAAISV